MRSCTDGQFYLSFTCVCTCMLVIVCMCICVHTEVNTHYVCMYIHTFFSPSTEICGASSWTVWDMPILVKGSDTLNTAYEVSSPVMPSSKVGTLDGGRNTPRKLPFEKYSPERPWNCITAVPHWESVIVLLRYCLLLCVILLSFVFQTCNCTSAWNPCDVLPVHLPFMLQLVISPQSGNVADGRMICLPWWLSGWMYFNLVRSCSLSTGNLGAHPTVRRVFSLKMVFSTWWSSLAEYSVSLTQLVLQKVLTIEDSSYTHKLTHICKLQQVSISKRTTLLTCLCLTLPKENES